MLPVGVLHNEKCSERGKEARADHDGPESLEAALRFYTADFAELEVSGH